MSQEGQDFGRRIEISTVGYKNCAVFVRLTIANHYRHLRVGTWALIEVIPRLRDVPYSARDGLSRPKVDVDLVALQY